MGTSLEKNSLEYLMALHYHQDYLDEYGGLWESLDAFLDEDPHRAPAVPGLIAEAFVRFPSDEELAPYIYEIGCSYNTSLYPGGVRAWLTEISRRVQAWLDEHPAEA